MSTLQTVAVPWWTSLPSDHCALAVSLPIENVTIPRLASTTWAPALEKMTSSEVRDIFIECGDSFDDVCERVRKLQTRYSCTAPRKLTRSLREPGQIKDPRKKIAETTCTKARQALRKTLFEAKKHVHKQRRLIAGAHAFARGCSVTRSKTFTLSRLWLMMMVLSRVRRQTLRDSLKLNLLNYGGVDVHRLGHTLPI